MTAVRAMELARCRFNFETIVVKKILFCIIMFYSAGSFAGSPEVILLETQIFERTSICFFKSTQAVRFSEPRLSGWVSV